MGKKLKLSIDNLKITSFVTSINGIRGGLPPTQTCACGTVTIGDDDVTTESELLTVHCGYQTMSCGPCTTANTTG